ncbi:MAG: MBL fold metallo-hydrolase [Chloroflexota bacterium]
MQPNQVTAVVLGIMQDGGLPHVGCRCRRCQAAYDDPRQMEYIASLAIIDTRGEETAVWLIDATPDIRYQLNLLDNVLGRQAMAPNRLRPPQGIFLTHAHSGHISGLLQLGPEAMNIQGLPIYTSLGLVTLLRETRLWRPVIQQLALIPLSTNRPVLLGPDLTIYPIPVPHRDEWGIGTFAFQISGPKKSLLYLPDIDSWDPWARAEDHLTAVDYALVDGTFYDDEELDGRFPPAHPPISYTLSLFGDLPCQLVLTHFNHTNPVLDAGSPERQAVLDAGASLAYTGQTFLLS